MRDEQQHGTRDSFAARRDNRSYPEKFEIEYIPIVVNHGSRSRASSRFAERKKGCFFAYQTRSLQYLTVELRDGIRHKQVRNGFCRREIRWLMDWRLEREIGIAGILRRR